MFGESIAGAPSGDFPIVAGYLSKDKICILFDKLVLLIRENKIQKNGQRAFGHHIVFESDTAAIDEEAEKVTEG